MKLRLALDFVDIPTALDILSQTGEHIQIVEVGTPFVINEGLAAVRKIKEHYPNLTILADLKIMDAGAHETEMAIRAGADIVTVLGVSDDKTILGCVEAAHKAGCRIMTDMIGVPNLTDRAREIDALGVDYICVHTAFDVQSTGKNPLEELQQLKQVIRNAKTAVAGGVNKNTIGDIVREYPEIIIIGGAITGSTDRRQAASFFQSQLT